ncbi:MAG TPA: hypothetical protein VF454_02610 [Gemmatimonadales bacterium]
MTFKPKIWLPIASVLAVINLGAVWFAAAPGEPLHATAHAVAAVAFALWAYRLKQRRDFGSGAYAIGSGPSTDTLALDVDDLRQALAETQERLDFAERILAQKDPQPRNDQER